MSAPIVCRTLLVASNPLLSRSLEHVLSALSEEVVTVRSRLDAVSAAGLAPLELVVIDANLEDEPNQGFFLAERLRQHVLPLATPLVVLGENARPHTWAAHTLELDAFITKPITHRRVVEQVLRAIVRRRALLPLHQARHAGQFRDALGVLERLLVAEPDYRACLLEHKGRLLLELDPHAAECFYRAAGKEGGQDAWCATGIAEALRKQQRIVDARKSAQAYLAHHPGYVPMLDALVEICLAQHAFAPARQSLAQAQLHAPLDLGRAQARIELALLMDDASEALQLGSRLLAQFEKSGLLTRADAFRMLRAAMLRPATHSIQSVLDAMGPQAKLSWLQVDVLERDLWRALARAAQARQDDRSLGAQQVLVIEALSMLELDYMASGTAIACLEAATHARLMGAGDQLRRELDSVAARSPEALSRFERWRLERLGAQLSNETWEAEDTLVEVPPSSVWRRLVAWLNTSA